MKRFLFALVGLFLVTTAAQSQEDGAKLAKQAGKALTSYNIDPTGNANKLDEAKQKIDQAMQLADAQALPSAWISKGDIYNTILQRDMAKRMIDKKAPLSGDNDALEAFTAYKKAYDIPTIKKYEKSDAVKGVIDLQGHLINIGSSKYEAGEYDKAYLSFQAALDCHDLLKANNEKTILDDPALYDDQMFYTAVTALLAKRNKEAEALYNTLKTKGYDKAAIYSGLYSLKTEAGDKEGAKAILEEGRKKYPEDTELLFSEINVYLQEGKLSELTDRLKMAIQKEPTNVGLYVTLGNVYDNLFQAMLKEKNDAKSKEYFDAAKAQYAEALSRDPKNVDATYSIGALYFNKAAYLTQEINALPEDYSSAGMKKMDALNKQVLDMFDQALPYFQKAESLNPSDLNTLLALSEIFARKNDEALMGEFKKRLDVVKGGGKNADSWFKQ